MKKIAFFDTKPYDRTWFDILAKHYEIAYFEEKLNRHTATLTDGFDAVCAFVNDRVDATAIDRMHRCGVQLLALRCAGFSNVDMQAAAGKLRVVRVPAYSPHAVAEHTMGLLLTLNRRLHRAYIRTRDFNFSIVGLTGIDLYKKTVGIIGTGRIGRAFAEICRGFGMKVIAYDLFPNKNLDFLEYVSLDELLSTSDLISLHCPMTPETEHLINSETIAKMKDGVILVNTSRGGLIKTDDLIAGIRDHKFFAVGLDVYEEESAYVYEDMSSSILPTSTIQRLLSFPNVTMTSHQGFFTVEALTNIAETTLENAKTFMDGAEMKNLVH